MKKLELFLFSFFFLQNGGKHFYLRGAVGGASAWGAGAEEDRREKPANQSAGVTARQMARVFFCRAILLICSKQRGNNILQHLHKNRPNVQEKRIQKSINRSQKYIHK